jgi:hypothetical protein
MSSPTRLAALALVLASLLALSASCTRPATQLVVVVDTDLPETGRVCFAARVSRLVGGVIEPGATRRLFVTREVGVPFSFGVVPPDGVASARVEIAIEALPSCEEPAPGARLVRRAVRTGFLEGQTLRVPLFLSASCGAGCIETLSCPATGDTCESIPTVEPEELAPVTPRAEIADAGAPIDAGGEACTPHPAAIVLVDSRLIAAATPTDAYTVEAIPGLPGWRAFTRRSATEVWAQRTSLELDAVFNDFGLDLPAAGNVVGISSVAGPTDTSAIVLVGDTTTMRAGRHLYASGSMDVATADLVPGAPIDGAAARLGADALFATRDGSIIFTRVPATAPPTEIGRESSGNTVALASRSDGSALYAIGGVPMQCWVRPISATGVVGALVVLPFSCDRTAVAELGSNVVLLFVDSGTAYVVLLDGTTLTAMGAPTSLGAAIRGDRLAALASPAGDSVRLVWSRDATTVLTQSVDASLSLGPLDTISFTSAEGPADAQRVRAARSGRRTAITFPGADATGGIVWASVCD